MNERDDVPEGKDALLLQTQGKVPDPRIEVPVADPTLAAYPAVALRPGPDGEPRDKVRPRDASRTGRILERAHIEIRQELDDRQAGLGSLGESIEDRRYLIVEKVASLRTISRHHPATLRACACDAGAKTTS